MTRIIKTITILVCSVSLIQGFSLDTAASISRKISSKPSSTKLDYARSNDSSSTITLEPPKVATTERNRHQKQVEDPLETIAFLNDPSRRYQKRRRPRALSDFDRERKAMAKAATKMQCQALFQEGQRAAERAIMSVLNEHNIQDDTFAP